jgi:hypothetical protein
MAKYPAFGTGLACVACEVWGSYDYTFEKYGRWNYLLVGSLVLTALAAVLPVGAEFAHRQGMRGLKWAAWCAVPLALAFVFTVSIQRTGGAADADETTRRQIAENIRLAKQEIAEAEGQLPIDKALVAKNCGVWGPICTRAKEDQAATEDKLSVARATLKQQGIVVDDSMARRIIAYLPFLTKEQVQLYQLMLLPMGLAIVGSLLIAIGVRRKGAKVESSAPVAEPAPLVREPEIITPRPRPKLVAARKDPPAAPVAELMTAALEPAKGRNVSLEQCFARYTSDSGKRVPMAPDVFMDAMSEFCRGVGIRTKIEGDKLYLIDVELADTSRAGRLGPMGREKRV